MKGKRVRDFIGQNQSSEAIREVVPLIKLVDDLKKLGLPMPEPTSVAKVKIFEDNAGAIEIAKGEKMRPRTKHLNVRWHWFRSMVQDGTLAIEAIRSERNPTDILTHPVNVIRLAEHVETLMKWHLLPKASEGVLQYLKSVDSEEESK